MIDRGRQSRIIQMSLKRKKSVMREILFEIGRYLIDEYKRINPSCDDKYEDWNPRLKHLAEMLHNLEFMEVAIGSIGDESKDNE